MSKFKFSEEQQKKIAQEYKEEKLTIREVAQRYNCGTGTITAILDRFNIERNNTKKVVTEEEYAHAIALRMSGVSVAKIAKEMGISVGALNHYFVCKDIKVVKPEKPKRTINIGIGSELTYRVSESRNNPDKRIKNITVIKSGPRYITCRHREGFLETFQKEDLVMLFQEGRMAVVRG